jgi:formylglycine-generating enzyme required for sulfatase activity
MRLKNILACAALCLPAALTAEPTPHRPGSAFADCSDCPEMVVIPPGKFIMGSTQAERTALGAWKVSDKMESPRHPVAIAYRFAVARYSVTFAQWDACVADGGCGGYRPDDSGWGRGRRPVVNVNFAEANAYIAWLKQKTGQPYRLLTEAEWEYSARAGTTSWFFYGSKVTPENANSGNHLDRTVSVGSYQPNAFGLYDMSGNSAQWVQDCYHNGYVGAPADGSPWMNDADCAVRNVRGGAWSLPDSTVRIAQRVGDPVAQKNNHLGFRVARDLP